MSSFSTPYGLSPAQQGLLFHALLAPGEALYFEQRWCTIDGPLDAPAFRAAWQQLLDTHDALRSAFAWRDGQLPTQRALRGLVLPWTDADWRGQDAAALAQRFERWCAEDRVRGFHPGQAPLMRCALLRVGDERHCFVWSYHHLLLDGWSNALLLQEVMQRYAALRGQGPVPAPRARPYREYIAWLEGQDREAARAHWRSALQAVQAPTALPWLRPAAPGAAAQPQQQDFAFSEAESAALERAARAARLTLNTLVQGAWALLLARAAAQDEVLFGTTVAGRPAELEDAARRIGLFMHTLPVSVRVPPAAAPLPWLQELQQSLRQHERHAHLGLAEIQRLTPVPGGRPLFDSVLVFENYPFAGSAALSGLADGLRLSQTGGFEQTNYPLALMVLPGSRLTLQLRHDSARLPGTLAAHLLRQVASLMRGLLRQGVRRLDALQAGEGEAGAACGVQRPLPAQMLPATIAARARQLPDAEALRVEPGDGAAAVSLSYRALDEAANRLAHHLRGQGLQRGQRVGVCLPRSAELLVALLAVWKAGAAYVPLDPQHPPARRARVIAHAGLARLIAPAALAVDGLAHTDPVADAAAIADADAQDPGLQARAIDPAYLIFTSGSTGQPKGVAVSHGALANLIASMAEAPGLRPGESLLALTTVAFDIAGLELWLPLCQGARVVLAGNALAQDAAQLAQQLERQTIDVMQATPATWQLLRDAGWSGRAALRAWAGGEALDSALAGWLLPRCAALWNLYGPTETTIWSTALRLDAALLAGSDSVPIGGPVANTRLWVRDAHGQPAPVGLPGELLIGGAGLAEGYHGQPALTAQVFVPGSDGQRLYRSGDLVRWREDGLLDFLGRADHQVKLRGHRIELGDIETALAELPGVRQAVVALRRELPGGPALVAYLRADAPAEAAWREALAARLPVYMQPTHWVCLERFPLTPNGKIDRAALPLPATRTTAAAPDADPLQALVGQVWADVLGRTAVDAEDDFFALGGHSLTAARMAARLDVLRPTGAAVPLRLLFEQPRLADFVAALRRLSGRSPALPPVQRGADEAPLQLLAAQQRQWLIAQFAPHGSAYTIGLCLQLQGALDVAALEAALAQLVARHEALRTAFVADAEGLPVARVWPAAPLALRQIAAPADAAALEAIMAGQLAQPFSLDAPPLLRATLLHTAPQQALLLLALHHIAADDASLGVLARELAAAYAQACGRGPALPPPPALRCRDVAAWQAGLDLATQCAYWQAQLHDAPLPQRLAIDRRRADDDGAAAELPAGRHLQSLDAAEVEALQALARRHGATLYMVLLAGFALLLQRYGAGDEVVIGSPVAGRPRTGQAELQDLVGMFVNTLPLRIAPRGQDSVAALLAQVRERTLAAWEHQDLPYERMLDTLPAVRRTTTAPLFEALFSLQSAHGALPGATLAGGLQWQPLPAPPRAPKAALSVALRPPAPGETPTGGLLAQWEFDASRFAPAAIARMAGHWAGLLAQMAQDAAQPLQALVLPTVAERARLDAFGRPAHDPPPPRGTVHGAFLRQAAKTPEAVALIDGECRWSYRQLAATAQAMALQLGAHGIRRGEPVGLWGERSGESIAALLAILMSGAAYVPLDPLGPPARHAALVRQLGVRCALAARPGCLTALRSELRTPLAEIIVPGPLPADAALPPAPADDDALGAEQLAYVMTTSGTTGGIKPVGTPHRGVLRVVQQVDYVELSAGQTVLHAAPLAFDASTFEIWSALLHGGTLVIAPLASLQQLADTLQRHRIELAWLSAGLLQVMVDERPEALAGLRQLVAGGDVLSAVHVARLLAAYPRLRLVNGYGPTETTTFACCHAVSAQDVASGHIPIGRPIAHTCVQVLDEAGQPVPIGLPGELYIGGAGVARGYLGLPAQTAAAFVPDPSCSLDDGDGGDSVQLLYRSGDRVAWREDGVLEFLGRADRQLKLRGFRIEPGEIEQRLVAHPQVLEAVVLPRTDAQGRKQLAAWLVAAWLVAGAGARPDAAALRRWCAQTLPQPWVPTRFEWIEALPLTANGKIDRAQLEATGATADDALGEAAPEAPAGASAQRLRVLCQALLPQRPIGLHDDFFDLGLDSIVALQLASRATASGLALTPAQVFQHPSVAALAAAIDAAGQAAPLADAARESGPLRLTPIQHWFAAQRLAVPSHFNQAAFVALPPGTAEAPLRAAFEAVQRRHDVFRLRWNDGSAELVAQDPPLDFEWHDLQALPTAGQDGAIEARAAAAQSGLDLRHGPLLRAAGFDLGARGVQLLIVIHHLAVDGVSWRVLMSEWQQAWQQAAAGLSVMLGPRPPGPLAWRRRLDDELAAARQELSFWHQQLQGPPAGLALDGPALQRQARTLVHRLSQAQTEALLQQADALPPMLVALLRALQAWTGRSDHLLELEAHGRDGAPEFAGSVGWFTAMYPLRLSLGDAAGDAAQLDAVRRRLQAVPRQGRGYGLLRWLDAQHTLQPPPALLFNYLGRLPGEGAAWQRLPVPGELQYPDNPLSHPIDVNCWIDQGRWTLAWRYAGRHFDAATMAGVAARFVDELALLAEGQGPTPSLPEDVAQALAQVSFGD